MRKLKHNVNRSLNDENTRFQTAESLASDSNKPRISHFMETLGDVKRINDADLVSSSLTSRPLTQALQLHMFYSFQTLINLDAAMPISIVIRDVSTRL
jgi:hypothetical protein